MTESLGTALDAEVYSGFDHEVNEGFEVGRKDVFAEELSGESTRVCRERQHQNGGESD
jgi:hypothetical protein